MKNTMTAVNKLEFGKGTRRKAFPNKVVVTMEPHRADIVMWTGIIRINLVWSV